MIDVYLGLGSNQAEPLIQLQQAIKALSLLPQTQCVVCSSFYQSLPMGPKDQADYVNAVLKIRTELSALSLLQATQGIEQQQGRVRKTQRWGPRTLDIDILLYGNEQIVSQELVVPHYGMREREFVLYPLAEIDQALSLPSGETLHELMAQCPINQLKVVAPALLF
ncbi:MAG: 2-amino-4-hydroxy-6-hydroxymethyldihydropteridine diphosphokinase [Paraglaciecola sp.]|nr:2-amino-4-hydroxy-6-hydroxymethyldihydropteridine diphosphokinase [Paraglaciecola sp.]NCT47354.1 2-amino-4-hydroxy-6-hydroxymethyldihydropteridine diphosphokinase [Paraglaciecola sp.]